MLFAGLQSAIRALDHADVRVLHELHDLLEVEVMIERTGRHRKRLLRALAEYCDERLHEHQAHGHRSDQDALSNRIRLLLQRARHLTED